jgi:tRNA (guanine-N7-)-methyltransferase
VRVRKKAWIPKRIQELSHLVVADPTVYKGQWRQYFQNDHPLHVEVGTGKGRFITTLADQNRQVNFIGVEYVLDVIYYAALRAADLDSAHIALLCVDVSELLDVFAVGEINRLYINFCDPWPKTRHAKRRLTHHDFLARYKKILARGGEIHFKTDNEQLFAYSLNEFAADRDFQLKNITLDLHNSEFNGNVMTEYEEKFSSEGMKIFRCEVQLLS